MSAVPEFYDFEEGYNPDPDTGPPPVLVQRQLATQKTLDRYRDKPFDWRRGLTCLHLARYQLRNMGHKPPTIPRIRSALAAKRALTARGCDSVSELLDTQLDRIAPLAMGLGDLCTISSRDGLDSVFIAAGGRKLFGWPDGEEGLRMIDIIDLDKLQGAWRV